MLSYSPDDSARQRVRDLLAEAQTRDRQQAWTIKKNYRLESQAPKYERIPLKNPRRSLA
jgi:hypothetical protein